MPKICYVDKKFSADHLAIIERANEILEEFARGGYTDVTLRSVFYGFVSRDWLPNTQRDYKRLGTIISDGRRAGLIDWSYMCDLTRNEHRPPAWDSPHQIIQAVADQYDVDWWEGQDVRPVVWVEKEAMVGVVARACEPWHLPYLACKGYMSDSETWAAAYNRYRHFEQEALILHLGDHDPSGIDMTRDIEERLRLFSGMDIRVVRLALNMDQIETYNPPPNPAKTTDARFAGYQAIHGEQSWELDSLPPTTVGEIIADAVQPLINSDIWEEREEARDEGRRQLLAVADNWEEVRRFLDR